MQKKRKKIKHWLTLFLLQEKTWVYSQKGLAIKANIDISIIEDIESGRELFLATPVRQKLASALKINATKIKISGKRTENKRSGL